MYLQAKLVIEIAWR